MDKTELARIEERHSNDVRWAKEKRNERWGFSAFAWFVCSVVLLLGTEIAINSSGREPNNHPEALPASVTQLNSTNYIIEKSDDLQPEDVCKTSDQHYNGPGTTDSTVDNPIVTVRQLPKLNSTYVSCAYEQTWGSKERVSPDFSQAMSESVQQSWLLGLIGFGGLLGLVVPGLQYKGRKRELNGNLKKARGQLQQQNVGARDELTSAFAQGKISASEYEQGLAQLMRSSES